MPPLLLLLAVIHLVGLVIILIATSRAPLGYEDQTGFHPRAEPDGDQRTTNSP